MGEDRVGQLVVGVDAGSLGRRITVGRPREVALSYSVLLGMGSNTRICCRAAITSSAARAS
jgi:hypothetical protein